MILTIGMGRLCDHLLTPEAVQAGKRRYAVVILAFGASVMVLAPYTASETLLLAEITFSLACVQSVFVNTYSLTNDLLHAGRSIGTAVGWIQLGGNIFGLAAPIVTGLHRCRDGEFHQRLPAGRSPADYRSLRNPDHDPPAGRRSVGRARRYRVERPHLTSRPGAQYACPGHPRVSGWNAGRARFRP